MTSVGAIHGLSIQTALTQQFVAAANIISAHDDELIVTVNKGVSFAALLLPGSGRHNGNTINQLINSLFMTLNNCILHSYAAYPKNFDVRFCSAIFQSYHHQ